MRDKGGWKVERLDHHLGAEERGAHPARIETQAVRAEQHVLNGSSQALDGHRHFGLPALWVRIDLQVFQIETGDYQHRAIDDTLVRLALPDRDNLRLLSVHLEIAPPFLG